MMNIDQIRVFITVAEHLHVTRAAKQLNMTQSAASASIATLEDHYGVRLFHRIGRNIALTQEGRLFLDESKRLLEHALRVESTLEDLSNLRRGALALQASLTIASYTLPRLMYRFRSLYPAITLALKIANTTQVAEAVLRGDSSIGFLEGEVDHPEFEKIPAGEDRVVLVVSPDHPWASVGRLEAAQLPDTPWIVREKGSGTRQVFQQAVQQNGLDFDQLNIALELPSNEAVRCAVEAGAGAAVMSLLVAESSLRARTLIQVDFALPTRPFVALCLRDRPRTRAEEAFLRMIKRPPQNRVVSTSATATGHKASLSTIVPRAARSGR